MRAPLVGLLVSLVIAAGWWVHRSVVLWPTLEVLELQTLDWRFRMRGAERAGDEIVLLAVDDRTMAHAPRVFERRAGQAEMIRAAKDAGARVVAVDLIFQEPEYLLAPGLIADVDAWLAAPSDADPEARQLLTRVGAEVHGDDALVAALKHAEAVLALSIGGRGDVPEGDRYLSRARYGQVVPGPWLPARSGRILKSDARFTQAVRRMGFITTSQDLTGHVREIPLALQVGEEVYVPLALQLLAAWEGVSRGKMAWLGTEGAARIGDRHVQGEAGRMRLNWRGPGAFRTVSVVDLLQGSVPREVLEGRIAIIGYSHLAQDSARSPFGSVPGFHVHATALDNLLRGDPIRRASPLQEAGGIALVGALVSLWFATRRLGQVVPVLGAVATVLGAGGAVVFVFVRAHLWWTLVGPMAAGGLALSACVALSWLEEGVQRRFLRRSFAQYLSDELVAELVADPSRASLSGERRELSVLFTDIRGFTGFSEQLAPEQLAAFLTGYLTPMTRAVRDHRGYVDKFIGDAVMALFGAPVHYPDHAAAACHAALAMFRARDEVRPLAEALGVELVFGAGINTGEMVVGNMGSAERFDYTVVGDQVNLASRLEGLTKTYGVFCLVTDDTRRAAGDGFRFRFVDRVRVQGRAEPVEIFELLGDGRTTVRDGGDPERWSQAQQAWRSGDFSAAREGFAGFEDDPVAAVYRARLDALGPTAPAGWDGVYTHTVK